MPDGPVGPVGKVPQATYDIVKNNTLNGNGSIQYLGFQYWMCLSYDGWIYMEQLSSSLVHPAMKLTSAIRTFMLASTTTYDSTKGSFTSGGLQYLLTMRADTSSTCTPWTAVTDKVSV